MALPLDRTLLAAPPLVVTLAQVRFEEHPECAEASAAAALREPMNALGLPVVAQVHQQQILVTGDPSAAEAATQRTAAGWQFKSKDEATVVTVMADQVSLETRRYAGWEAFEQTWRTCVEALAAVIDPQLATRLGLRYVNRVQPRGVRTAAEWHEHQLVETAFLGPAVGSTLSEHVTTAEGRTVVSFGDGVDAMIHHGVVAEGEAQVFVLDIDCFLPQAETFEVDAVMESSKALNDHSLEIFQSVIKEPLRREMLEGQAHS